MTQSGGCKLSWTRQLHRWHNSGIGVSGSYKRGIRSRKQSSSGRSSGLYKRGTRSRKQTRNTMHESAASLALSARREKLAALEEERRRLADELEWALLLLAHHGLILSD